MRSLYSMWISLVARKTWMRGCLASFTASHAASMSPFVQRAREATVAFSTTEAIVWTLLKSMGDAMAKPASITSTPSFSSWRAISIFSFKFMLQPGDCSPSRRVVSKILMRFILFFLLNLMIFRPKAYKKGLRLLLPVRDESLNFRGTTLIDICPCGRVSAFQYRPGAAGRILPHG